MFPGLWATEKGEGRILVKGSNKGKVKPELSLKSQRFQLEMNPIKCPIAERKETSKQTKSHFAGS